MWELVACRLCNCGAVGTKPPSVHGALQRSPMVLPGYRETGLPPRRHRRYQFCKHTSDDANWLPSTKSAHFVSMAVLMGGTTAAALMLDTDTAVNVIGIGGDAIVVAMFGGPLVAIKTVIQEKSTRSLPFAFTVAAFVNCSLWST